jgi:hypothetical protein
MRDHIPRLSATELAKTHYKTPALVEHGIRCGKPNCKCAGDYRHGPYAYLYWRDHHGKAQRVYVRKADVDAVREIVNRRQCLERERRTLLRESRAYLRELRALGKAHRLW